MARSKKSEGGRESPKVLPITAEQLRNPQEFNFWLFSQTPIVLQELYDNLADAPASERIKVLHSVFETCLSQKPYIKQESNSMDNTALTLADMLNKHANQAWDFEEEVEKVKNEKP
jgi:hypothetical protein